MTITPEQREHYAAELILEHVVNARQTNSPANFGLLRDLADVVIAARFERELQRFNAEEIKRIERLVTPEIRIERPDGDD